MLAGLDAVARRLDADDRDRRIVEEGMEQADRVGAAADAGDERVGQPALGLHASAPRVSSPITRLEVAHHRRIGVRAGRRADAVEGRLDMVATQSRSASFIASLSVAAPAFTGRTSAPSSFMRKTLGAWRSTSIAPMKTTQGRPNSAQAVAVATPCWPAPVSAMIRVLPMRLASRIWPSSC